LASDIIGRKYRHLFPDVSLSEKLERDDLIDRKLKHMSEATARWNLFTLLKFDIEGFIYHSSIKRNALEMVDVMVNDQIAPLMTKTEIEDHLLTINPQAYRAAGSTHFGHTDLGRTLVPTGPSPLADSILDGSFSHPNHAINDFTYQLQ
jgi:hypothetical protein